MPDVNLKSVDSTAYTPVNGTHSFVIASPLGKIQHIFSRCSRSLNSAFFAPLGSHYYWVDRGSMQQLNPRPFDPMLHPFGHMLTENAKLRVLTYFTLQIQLSIILKNQAAKFLSNQELILDA